MHECCHSFVVKKRNGDIPLDFKETSVFLKSNGPPHFFVMCKEQKTNKQTCQKMGTDHWISKSPQSFWNCFKFYFLSCVKSKKTKTNKHTKEKKNWDRPLDFKETSVCLKSNGPSPFVKFLFFVMCKEQKNKNKQTNKQTYQRKKKWVRTIRFKRDLSLFEI